MRARITTGVLLGGALMLSGCAAGGGDAAGGAVSDDTLQIVASTNVYGDIASSIGGDLVEVTSIITGSAQDPHSYEATAQDQLALSNAELVIENGGGYDPFIDTLLDGSANADVAVLNAVDASGLLDESTREHDADAEHEAEDEQEDGHSESGETADDHADDAAHDHIEGFNEHVWYSFHGVEHIAEQLAAQLGELDPANAETYTENLQSFAAELDALHERGHAMEPLTEGRSAAITEPVPLYLLSDIGLDNATPEEFSEAIEEGTDVAPAVLQRTLGIFSDDDVALLAYNGQTAGPETDQVRGAAEEAGVPVVSFTETLPEGDSYLEWMSANLDAIDAALT